MLQEIAVTAGTMLLLLLLAAWSNRGVRPIWPATVFAVACIVISLWTGPGLLPTFATLATGAAGLILGTVFFWLLQRTKGSRLQWLVLVVGVISLAFIASWHSV